MAGIIAAVVAQRHRHAAARCIQMAVRRRIRAPLSSATAHISAEREAKTLSYQLSYLDDLVADSSLDAYDVPASRIFMFALRRGRRPKRLGFHWKHGYITMEDLGPDDDPEDWTTLSVPYRAPFVALQMSPETYRTLDTFVPSFWGDSSLVFQSTRWEQEQQFDVFNNRMFQDFAGKGKCIPPRVMPLLLNPFLVLWAQLDSIVATFGKSVSRHRAILAERAEHFTDVYG